MPGTFMCSLVLHRNASAYLNRGAFELNSTSYKITFSFVYLKKVLKGTFS